VRMRAGTNGGLYYRHRDGPMRYIRTCIAQKNEEQGAYQSLRLRGTGLALLREGPSSRVRSLLPTGVRERDRVRNDLESLELESDLESESESESESEPEPEDPEEDPDDDLLLLRPARSFSLAERIASAVPATTVFVLSLFDLNSSGISTLGLSRGPDSSGFSSSFVLDGLERYGREFLHSYIKCPRPRHF